RSQAERVERRRNAPGTAPDLTPARPANVAGHTGDDLAVAEVTLGPLEKRRESERGRHHQSIHGSVSGGVTSCRMSRHMLLPLVAIALPVSATSLAPVGRNGSAVNGTSIGSDS